MTNPDIENAEVIEETTNGGTKQSDTTAQQTGAYPDGWRQNTKALWNGAIFTAILIMLCAILVFFFPKEGIPQNIGLGTLLVYFLILTFTALGSINTYQKGLTQFASLFGKDGSRAIDIIRWGFMFAMMGVLFHIFIFYLPFTSPESRHTTSTLLIGNSILILSTVTTMIGFLMLATANGCPDAARKGSLRMLLVPLLLLGGAFLAPFAIAGTAAIRILELIVLLGGTVLFLASWHKIITINPLKA